MRYNTKIIVALLVVFVGVGSFCAFNYYQTKKYEAKAWKIFGYDISLPSLPKPELYTVYKLYMDWVRAGVTSGRDHIAFPADLMRWCNRMPSSTLRYRPTDLLGRITFDHTTRFGWAMTDCYEIYFGGTSGMNIVDRLKNNQALTRNQVYWLSHELAHGEQCARLGSRQAFANKWFSQIFNLIWQKIITGDFVNVVNTIRSAGITAFDNDIGMEKGAVSRSNEVLRQFDLMRYPYAR